MDRIKVMRPVGFRLRTTTPPQSMVVPLVSSLSLSLSLSLRFVRLPCIRLQPFSTDLTQRTISSAPPLSPPSSLPLLPSSLSLSLSLSLSHSLSLSLALFLQDTGDNNDACGYGAASGVRGGRKRGANGRHSGRRQHGLVVVL